MFIRLDIIVALQVCTHEVHGDLILIALRLSLNLSEYLSIDSLFIYISLRLWNCSENEEL